MVFNQIQSNRYDVELIKPFKNAQTEIKQRSGSIIKLVLDGECGCGEAAPLSPYSKESLTEVSWAFEELKIALKHNSNYTFNDLLDLFELYAKDVPSLHFALDLSLYDILAKKEKVPLASYLNSKNIENVNFSSIYNGGINKSFKTIKVKLGLHSLDKEIDLLYNLFDQYDKDITFRIDANQAYNIDEFLYLTDKLKKLNIQYIEEPLSLLNIKNLEIIKNKCAIPIAIDESIFQNNFKQFVENKLVDYAIIKPSLYGGVKSIFKLCDYFKEYNVQIILSSALHTKIGNLANIHLASALELSGNHGLNNHVFFNFDKNTIPYGPDDCKINIKNMNGLGVCLDD